MGEGNYGIQNYIYMGLIQRFQKLKVLALNKNNDIIELQNNVSSNIFLFEVDRRNSIKFLKSSDDAQCSIFLQKFNL